MVLKIKKDDFNWLYIETNRFEIYKTYDDKPLESKLGPIDLSYTEAKRHSFVNIERPVILEKEETQLKTYINTDDTTIICVGDFIGFVLNDEGKTIERL